MRNDSPQPTASDRPEDDVGRLLARRRPRPSTSFRRRAWHAFQRALDPLGPPRPLRQPRR